MNSPDGPANCAPTSRSPATGVGRCAAARVGWSRVSTRSTPTSGGSGCRRPTGSETHSAPVQGRPVPRGHPASGLSADRLLPAQRSRRPTGGPVESRALRPRHRRRHSRNCPRPLRDWSRWTTSKLLDIRLNRLRRWLHPTGCCGIGDAAHAHVAGRRRRHQHGRTRTPWQRPRCSRHRFVEHRVTADDLAAVQRRREFPTTVTQTFSALSCTR